MNVAIEADLVPLRVDESGDIRVGNTRILLDLIVHEYERGTTPQQMVEDYDVLELADVYGAISYYLRHRDQVNDYIRRREKEADALRKKLEAVGMTPPAGFGDEIRRRWAERTKDAHASSGQ